MGMKENWSVDRYSTRTWGAFAIVLGVCFVALAVFAANKGTFVEGWLVVVVLAITTVISTVQWRRSKKQDGAAGRFS